MVRGLEQGKLYRSQPLHDHGQCLVEASPALWQPRLRRSATYALTAVLPGGTLWRQRVHQHPRSVLQRDRGVLSRPAGRE